MLVLIGSKNPVKIAATQSAFLQFFDNATVQGYSVSSRVPDQPVNKETFDGAYNRTLALQQLNHEQKLNASYFVGIEGGIGQHYSHWFAFGGICIMNSEGHVSYGTSPNFQLPESTIERLLNGEELGFIVDEWTKEVNTKQKGGAVGFLTDGRMDRKQLYIHGLVAALIPFLNADMYFEK